MPEEIKCRGCGARRPDHAVGCLLGPAGIDATPLVNMDGPVLCGICFAPVVPHGNVTFGALTRAIRDHLREVCDA